MSTAHMGNALASSLHARLTTRTARVGVVGLGYVGLPLLVELARSGYEAVGFDVDASKIAAIAEGRSYIPDVSSSGDVSARILVAGIAYKRDIDDVRESPALDVMSELRKRGAAVSYADPFVPALDGAHWPGGEALSSIDRLDARTLQGFDCVAILTDHQAFDYAAMVRHADLVVDTRNAIKEPAAHVFRLGAPAYREAPTGVATVAGV
jgi:UDP-N-acetyl-D-mannosaminuronate dehydrogenase